MNFYRSFAGYLRIEATSASIADMLSAVNDAGIVLTDVTPKNDLVVEATVSRSDYQRLEKLLSRRGEKFKVTQKQGVFWSIAALRRRPVLVVGLAIYLILAMYLPTRVLFVKVEGNKMVTTQAVLEEAEQIGISFGASRRDVRSEAVKNALLTAMPQLQWAGINTYGCVAVISVEERTEEIKIRENKSVCSVVAKCDGVIQEMTVTRGNALCKVGQAVTAGQVLVSGYTDCGIIIKATTAEAEVYADTLHELEAVTPTQREERTEIDREESRYYLIFGKNMIKLFKDSGISDASCVKMYEESYLTLPGGFQLPVALVQERLVYYTQDSVCAEDASAFSWLEHQIDEYLTEQMVAGKIINSEVTTTLLGDAIYFNGKYSCYEMIGQVYSEEIYKDNG